MTFLCIFTPLNYNIIINKLQIEYLCKYAPYFLFKTALMHRYEGLAKSNKITCSTRRKGHTENSSINNLQFSVYPLLVIAN